MVFLQTKQPKYFQRGLGNLLVNLFHEKLFPFITSLKSPWIESSQPGRAAAELEPAINPNLS